MIRRLDALSNLAIVGMSVVVPGGGDINEFGRRVYRGLPVTGEPGEKPSIESAAAQAVREACGGRGVGIHQVPIINLSARLTKILKQNSTSSRIEEVPGVTRALIAAADRLESGDEDAVLLIEDREESALVCAVLVMKHMSAIDNARPIFALIAGGAEADEPLSGAAISGVINAARQSSGADPESTGLIITATLRDGEISKEEVEGLLGAGGAGQTRTCALGNALGGLPGIVNAAWCLSRRLIPCAPGWNGPEHVKSWEHSPYYVEADSRTWFMPGSLKKRFAGLNLLEPSGNFSHILFCDAPVFIAQCNAAPKLETLHLFPVAAGTTEELREKVAALESKLVPGINLAETAQDTYRQYIVELPGAKYAVSLLGSSRDELLRETGFAAKGIPIAIEKRSDWQTPLGSFFTPNPLGPDGKISFVYPGAFNSYPGIGRDLFYLYPILFDQLSELSEDIGGLLNEQRLYPRSLTPVSSDDLNAIEEQLSTDPITMLISGSCLACLYTDVLQKVFEIQPASAFGYSLGEVSMLFASRVWTEADDTSKALRESPLFRTRLTGPQNAVREYWKLPVRSENDPPEALWGNYLLMTGPEKVKEALADEPQVYLTHINTPRQVVIGGDPAGCRKVISKLKCKSIEAPFNYAIHCEPIHSEYEELMELHSVPVSNQPDMTLYSAATFQPMPIDRQMIAKQIAQELCHCLDFPRLIQQAYIDGARIFIELGAGSNCARWVNDTLQGQAHAAYSINRKGVDDHTSILRLMARLVSHQVPATIKVLYQD